MAFKGVVSAYELINLLSIVSSGHFSTLRDFLLIVPSRFIIQHFHSFNNRFNKGLPPTLAVPSLGHDSIASNLIDSINKTRDIFVSLTNAPVKLLHELQFSIMGGVGKKISGSYATQNAQYIIDLIISDTYPNMFL